MCNANIAGFKTKQGHSFNAKCCNGKFTRFARFHGLTIVCLLPWASRTALMIWDSSVEDPTFSALKVRLPLWLRVPANILWPVVFSTATGSPVIVLSSTNDAPPVTSPTAVAR